MITQRFFIEGDPADPAAWQCLDCGSKLREAAMKHAEGCLQMSGQEQIRELRQEVQAQKMELAQKDHELAALHIWGAPAQPMPAAWELPDRSELRDILIAQWKSLDAEGAA